MLDFTVKGSRHFQSDPLLTQANFIPVHFAYFITVAADATSMLVEDKGA